VYSTGGQNSLRGHSQVPNYDSSTKILEEWWQKERKKITPHDSSYYAFTFTGEYQCYHCDFKTENKGHYESHVIIRHGHSPTYPNKAEIEKHGLKLQGKELGVMRLQEPTLESFGFDIAGSNKIGGNLAYATSSTNNHQIPICYPFVKWAGGKRQLLPQLSALAPAKFERYFEPFLGGGAFFFHLMSSSNHKINSAYISDINPDLINAYTVIRDDCQAVIGLLEQYKDKYKDRFEYVKDPKKTIATATD
jgi:hypothetical protein